MKELKLSSTIDKYNMIDKNGKSTILKCVNAMGDCIWLSLILNAEILN